MTADALEKLPGLTKVFCFIPRKPNQTESQFHAHWRHPHGTLATRIHSVRRYIQSHKIKLDHGFRDALQDGVAELWFDDVQTANSLNGDPDYADYCGVDEWNFIDIGENAFRVVAEETVILDGRLGTARRGVKLMQLLRRPTHLSVGEFNHHWSKSNEAALADALGASELIYCRSTRDNYDVDRLPDPGSLHHWLTVSPYDGIREIWWRDRQSFERARRSAAWSKLSEAMPIDHETSAALAIEEIVIVDEPSGFVAAVPEGVA